MAEEGEDDDLVLPSGLRLARVRSHLASAAAAALLDSVRPRAFLPSAPTRTALSPRLCPHEAAFLCTSSCRDAKLLCEFLRSLAEAEGVKTVSARSLEESDLIGAPMAVVVGEGSAEDGVVHLRDRETWYVVTMWKRETGTRHLFLIVVGTRKSMWPTWQGGWHGASEKGRGMRIVSSRWRGN